MIKTVMTVGTALMGSSIIQLQKINARFYLCMVNVCVYSVTLAYMCTYL
jgi:hypothetical protein